MYSILFKVFKCGLIARVVLVSLILFIFFQFSDVVSCVVILLVLLFVGPLLEPLPVACLSSIIMVNIRTLFHQFSRLPQLWKLCKYDFVSTLFQMMYFFLPM